MTKRFKMNKQEILDEINKTKEYLANLENMLIRNMTKTDLKCEILSDCCYMVDGLIKSPEKSKIIKRVRKIVKDGK